jgi:hypothetical protein
MKPSLYLEYTFSCTFHDKHSPRKCASKQASTGACSSFPFLLMVFFNFFPVNLAPGTSFSIKGYYNQKKSEVITKSKKHPTTLLIHMVLGVVLALKNLSNQCKQLTGPFISSKIDGTTLLSLKKVVLGRCGQVGTLLCMETGTALGIKDSTRLI